MENVVEVFTEFLHEHLCHDLFLQNVKKYNSENIQTIEDFIIIIKNKYKDHIILFENKQRGYVYYWGLIHYAFDWDQTTQGCYYWGTRANAWVSKCSEVAKLSKTNFKSIW